MCTYVHVYIRLVRHERKDKTQRDSGRIPVMNDITVGKTPTSTQSISEEFLFNHKHQILSIHSCLTKDKHSLLFSKIDASFLYLQSLTCQPIEEPALLRTFLANLILSLSLISLIIDTGFTLNELNDIYQLIFQLPKLKYLNFSAIEKKDLYITIQLPLVKQLINQSIEYLIIDHPCTLDDLIRITSYSPQVHHLRCSFLNINDSSRSIGLLNLKSLSIDTYDIPFDRFESFMIKISASLAVLTCSTRSHDLTFLDSDRWGELIVSNINQLI